MKQDALPSQDKAAQDEADAREFEDYASTQDPVQVQAALWATRRSAGVDAATEAEFQDWLRAAPAHADAYEEIGRPFESMRGLPRDRIQSLREGLRQFPARPASGRRQVDPAERPTWLSRFSRQAATAMAVAVVVCGGWMGWEHWRAQPTFVKNYVTARHQGLDVRLPDGSTLQLDAAVHAEVRLYRQRREVRLIEGQALFNVQANPTQPFDVLAGAVRVTVVGTRFSVRHTRSGLDAGKTVVAVESGRVRVNRIVMPGEPLSDGATTAMDLTAGQGVTADQTGRIPPVVNIAPGSVAGWLHGRVSFNDTPLSEALAELERYGDTGLVVRDPAVGALRLGGSFDLSQIGAFAQALPSLLPVRLERHDGVLEIVRRR